MPVAYQMKSSLAGRDVPPGSAFLNLDDVLNVIDSAMVVKRRGKKRPPVYDGEKTGTTGALSVVIVVSNIQRRRRNASALS